MPRDGSLSSNSPLQYKTTFRHTFSIPMQSLTFLSILMGSTPLIIDGHIGVFKPHTQPYSYPFYKSNGIVQWSQSAMYKEREFGNGRKEKNYWNCSKKAIKFD